MRPSAGGASTRRLHTSQVPRQMPVHEGGFPSPTITNQHNLELNWGSPWAMPLPDASPALTGLDRRRSAVQVPGDAAARRPAKGLAIILSQWTGQKRQNRVPLKA